MKRGNWTDNPCYYVDAVDGNRLALLAGPFQTLPEAQTLVDKCNKLAQDYGDPRAWFYAYGTCKMPNGHREGLFNSQLGL